MRRLMLALLLAAWPGAVLVELAGARHFFDVQDLPALVRLPNHDGRAHEEAVRRVKETLVAALGGG